MHDVLTKIGQLGVVPVITIHDAEKAVPLARALIAGGLPCAEITLRTSCGEESIRRIACEVPQLLLGAGTVTTPDQVDRAAAAGARFIVSPGFNPKVVAHCLEKGVPVIPGCSHPSDLEAALEQGIHVVKFFPAEQSGGLDYIKAVSAPYPTVKFVPTGGINAGNLPTYLAHEKVLACGGSWMAPASLIQSGDFEGIIRLCQEAVGAVLGFALAHVGINSENEEQAVRTASLFAQAFGFEIKDGQSSLFAGASVEVIKSPYWGQNGHIALRTNSIARARAHLEAKGFGFREDTVKIDDSGRPVLLYLDGDFGGFAVHLVQKK